MSYEFYLMEKTLALIDDVLAQNPRAKEIMDEAYQQEADLEADRQYDQRKLDEAEQRHIEREWPFK